MRKLEALDASFTVIPDPGKSGLRKGVKYFVNSVPREVDMAFQDVLQAAQPQGCVAARDLAQLPMWGTARAELILSQMVQEGVCMVDEGDPSGHTLFWFPAIFER